MGFKVTGDLEVTGTVKIGADTLTATGAELNFVDGVTSAIQTQIDGKAGLTNWGNPEGGYKFDGVDDYVTVADNANLDFGTGDFSIEASIKLDSVTASQRWMAKVVGSNDKWYLSINAGGVNGLFLADVGGATVISSNIIYNFIANVNYHLVLTSVRGGALILYINGVALTLSPSINLTTTISNSGVLYLGAYNPSSLPINGKIYLFRLYNRALTASEVTSLYNNGRPDLASLPYDMIGGSQTNLIPSASSAFATNGISYWTAQRGTLSHNAGTEDMTYTVTVVGEQYFQKANLLTIGKRYLITFRAKSSNITGTNFKLYAGTVTINSSTSPNLTSDYQNYIFDVTIVAGSLVIQLTANQDVDKEFTIDDIIAVPIGCVAEYLPSNAGKFGWQETQNGLNGATSGSPVSLLAEGRPLIYRDVKLAIATATPTLLTGLVPKGYAIKSIVAKGSASLTAIKIGTSSSGEQIVASSTATATGTILTLASTANDGFSQTTGTNVYVEHTTSAQTMDVCFILEKLTR